MDRELNEHNDNQALQDTAADTTAVDADMTTETEVEAVSMDDAATAEVETVTETVGVEDASATTNNQAMDRLPGVSAAEFDALTGRSQEFLVNVNRRLSKELDADTLKPVYQEMMDTLLTAQNQGMTARQVYGTPTEVVQSVLDQELGTADQEANQKSPDWQIALDGGLLLGSLYVLMTGFTLSRQQGASELTGTLGLTTMLINYAVAGFAMLKISQNLPNPDAPKGKKGYGRYFIVSMAVMALWFFAISLTSVFLPPVINPILPANAYLLIGGLTLLLKFILKRRWNIQGGIF